MGKGDQRSKKGKRSRGSYGKARPHKDKTAKKTTPPRKPPTRGR